LYFKCLSANQKGDLVLKIKSEMAAVSVSFKDLMQANWSEFIFKMFSAYVCL